MTTTCLYSPYKSIGYVTDGIPVYVNYLGDEVFIVSSVRNAFQIYRLDKLAVCMVGQMVAEGNITAIQCIGHKTYVAVNKLVHVYERTRIAHTLTDHEYKILGMLSIGKILVTYDAGNVIKVFDDKGKSLVNSLRTLQNCKISCVVHPASYINKILIGYENGELELWNIMRSAIIYTFSSHKNYLQSKSNITNLPRVSAMEQSPAGDVFGIGFDSGNILMINLKLDIILFAYKQDGGAVTSLSFRSDIGAEKSPYMVSGSADGRIHVWNLGQVKERLDQDTDEEGSDDSKSQPTLIRRLENSISDAHMSSVSKVHFLHGEPVLISSSSDNSIKVWIFDNTDGSARLLKSRQGHQGPSLHLRFYGAVTNASMRDNNDGHSNELLSSGSDGTFRYFNTAIENQNREMSQLPMLRKLGLKKRNQRLNAMIDFDSSETRQGDWANLVSIHKDDSLAYLWKYKDRVITDVALRQPKPLHWEKSRKNNATAVAVSSCGNFALVGTRGGVIYKYNMQSGLPRGKFPQNTVSDMNPHTYYIKSNIPGNVIHEASKILKEDDEGHINPVVKSMAKLRSEKGSQSHGGHTNEITGLFVNITSTVLVSCGLDGQLIFWDYMSHNFIQSIYHSCQLLIMRGHRDGGFVAIAGQDRVVRVYDLSTHKLSRRFAGHTREITDICFTPDGRRLISSSTDGSVRTWDMPTGRCLSWILFETAVLSITVSLSGEFLCVSQADRDGIGMYVDRSLYETIHFWKEPDHPTPIRESGVRVESANDDTLFIENDFTNDEKGDSGENKEDDGLPATKYIESSFQRGEGSITLSAVPKAYWTTLFHLEAIKSRNKGVETDVVKQKEAPFFLPTIHREGAAPSFPTPQEFNSLTGSLKRGLAEIGSPSLDSKRYRLDEVEENEDDVAQQLAGMSSAWHDGGDDQTAWIGEDSKASTKDEKLSKSESASSSRILRRKVILPRCRLVAYIMQEFPGLLEDGIILERSTDEESPILSFLKTLSPSAVDVEMRSLCLVDTDEEGVRYLIAMVKMFSSELALGSNFEILQAYLHRFMLIYSETLGKISLGSSELLELKARHGSASQRFRHLLQKNLCLLKVFAKLPSI